MIFSTRTLALGLGFFLVSIFPSAFKIMLGGSSIRNGLVLSLIIFIILAIPFGVRYFMNSKIVLVNFIILFLILLFYLISSLFYPGGDIVRAMLSLMLLLVMSFMAIVFITTLDTLKSEVLHKIILTGFHSLIFLGLLVLFLRAYPASVVWNLSETILDMHDKSMILFTEPYDLAL